MQYGFFSKVAVLAAGLLATTAVQAAQTASTSSQLRANFRRVGLELSETSVSHAEEYANSPVTQLSADGQTLIKGVFDFVLEYDHENMRWDNSIFMNYGKTKIKPANGPAESSENEDKILLTSDFTYKLWRVHNLDLGPFVSGAYQTEFTENDDAPRMKVWRGKTGLKLLSGKFVKELYVAGVGEYDMTYSEHVSKSAAEIGWRLEKDLRDGVKLSTDGYFRKYLSFSEYVGTDLKHDLSLTARMDVAITKTLTFGPYLSYRLAKAREADVTGSNLMIGVSLAYTDLFQLLTGE